MGVQDRDSWKERHRHSGGTRSTPAVQRRRPARIALLAACLLSLAYWVGKGDGLAVLSRWSPSTAGKSDSTRGRPSLACSDAFPAAGALAGEDEWQRHAPRKSMTRFVNRTPADRIVDLLHGDEVKLSIAVPAHAEATVDLPVGAHAWRLRNGAAWCDRGWRFVREQRTVISPPLEIVASSQLTVDITSDPDHPTGFSLRTRDAPVVATIGNASSAPAATSRAGDGTLLLPRSTNGHYFVDGTIDGEAVRFMVDTGASRIAVPVPLARRLGYYQGREVVVNTAGGQTTGSEFQVRRVTFGPFVAENVTVIAMMNLETPLLGMSLLQSIELRQTPAGLELRRVR